MAWNSFGRRMGNRPLVVSRGRRFALSFYLFLLLPILAKGELSGDVLRADILEINRSMRAAIIRESSAPPIAARNLALMHRALHRAMIDISNRGRKVSTANFRSALIGVGIEILNTTYPSTSWDAGKIVSHPDDTNLDLFRLGRQVAREILVERSGDGASQSITYIPQSEPGKWRRTGPRFRPPELPQWPLVRPFVLPEPSIFRAPPPPALDSADYAKSWDEVRLLGARDSSVRTEEQTEIARFWSYFSYTSTPPGVWNEIAGILAESRGLDGKETVELFCMLNLALADAGIVAHETKYHYNFWRPVHAIHRAEEDDNPATVKDPNWRSFLEDPPHPEYVSGHSTFSGAGAQVLTLFFKSEGLPFSLRSESFPDHPRHFDSPWAAAREAGRSRIFGGIHYGFSNRAGLEAGRKVADYVFEHHVRCGKGPAVRAVEPELKPELVKNHSDW